MQTEKVRMNIGWVRVTDAVDGVHLIAFGQALRSRALLSILFMFIGAWPVAAQETAVRIYNIALYFSPAPECVAKFESELRVNVRSFGKEIAIGKILEEVARSAAEKGAEIVHSITLIS